MILLFFLFVSLSLWGTASEAGAIFLAILPGSPVGMGGSYTSIDGDLWSTYYNVAGTATLTRRGLSGQHSNWLKGMTDDDDMYYEYAALGMPYRNGFLFLSIIYLNAGTIQATTENYQVIDEYSPFDISIMIGYSKKLSENLLVGFGLKYIYCFLVPEWIMREYFNRPGGGAGMSGAIDAGVIYKIPKYNISMGASISNLGPPLTYASSDTKDPLPITLRLGVSYYYDVLSNGVFVLRPTIDVIKVIAKSTDSDWNVDDELKDIWYAGGVELIYSSMFYLKGGYFYDKVGARIGPTYGGGVKLGLGKTGAEIKIDVSIDSYIYDFDVENYRISFDFYY